jgi:endonuclease-3
MIKKILAELKEVYTDLKPELDYSNPLELLVAVILSAQCTDKQVNLVTPALFKKYKSPTAYAKAKPAELEELIHSTGFYKNKAKNIIGCCQRLISHYNGQIPQTMEDLTTLPGVGRKTANVILSHVFGKNEGICVDTHVMRLSQRLGLTQYKDAIRIERDLMKITPQEDWVWITQTLILHGRRVCLARNPHCEICVIRKYCPWYKNLKN